ncbi:MAG: TlpA disulfide reductase family protein [Chitinophagaceae bacterium]
MRKTAFWIFLSFVSLTLWSQRPLVQGSWKGVLTRTDGHEVPFLFSIENTKDHTVIQIHNGKERLSITDITRTGDSLYFTLPFFEASFQTQLQPDGHLTGAFIRSSSTGILQFPFRAYPGQRERFQVTATSTPKRVAGIWEATFTRSNGTERPSVASFEQQGSQVTGTFLNPAGDYRYLEGIVNGDSLFLSAFDGSHIHLFTALIDAEGNLTNGWYYSGLSSKEPWKARRNPMAALPDSGNTPRLKEGFQTIQFSFPDLDSNWISSADPRFAGKVVIVQIMGSWCPNCMDETAFLSQFYKKYQARGLEVVALAYEYSTDFQRSRKSLLKFKNQFQVTYPMLITGVKVGDSLRTEKTLPQLTSLSAFPTLLFIGKEGNVRKIESGFSGPGTGQFHEAYKKSFTAFVEQLLAE